MEELLHATTCALVPSAEESTAEAMATQAANARVAAAKEAEAQASAELRQAEEGAARANDAAARQSAAASTQVKPRSGAFSGCCAAPTSTSGQTVDTKLTAEKEAADFFFAEAKAMQNKAAKELHTAQEQAQLLLSASENDKSSDSVPSTTADKALSATISLATGQAADRLVFSPSIGPSSPDGAPKSRLERALFASAHQARCCDTMAKNGFVLGYRVEGDWCPAWQHSRRLCSLRRLRRDSGRGRCDGQDPAIPVRSVCLATTAETYE